MDDRARRRNVKLGVLLALSQFFTGLSQVLPITRGEGTAANWCFAFVSLCLMIGGIVIALKNRPTKH